MSKTKALNLPEYKPKVRRDGDNTEVWDRWRKKYVVLTPEEFVRQHFVNWLSTSFGYPDSLISNEIGIELNGTRRRCDTVVFDAQGNPQIIVEYKAPNVNITEAVFDQIFRYNSVLRVKYLIVSNGIRHFCCVIDYETDSYKFVDEIPHYNQ